LHQYIDCVIIRTIKGGENEQKQIKPIKAPGLQSDEERGVSKVSADASSASDCR